MSAQHSNQAGQDGSATLGVGGDTSGAEGVTPEHESMAETGGSGGDALTKPHREEAAPASGGHAQAEQRQDGGAPDAEGAGTAATAIVRGAQDTRSRQASPGSTGLGTPETGGNQNEGDLAPPRQ